MTTKRWAHTDQLADFSPIRDAPWQVANVSNREPTDYLYCDDQRINSYFEQISGPVAYDKVPVWKAGLSLTGPTAEGSQARPGRPFTMHEKVHKIVNHLRKGDLVDDGRLEDPFSRDRPFRIEAMSARKALIRPRTEMPDFRGLSLWVSAQPDGLAHQADHPGDTKVGALFLLEDFPGEDRDYAGFRFSGYSWLVLLSDVLHDVPGVGSLPKDLGSQFAADPVTALIELGAVFGPERRVVALYKVRAACMARENGFASTTIGYPLVVTAEGGVLLEE